LEAARDVPLVEARERVDGGDARDVRRRGALEHRERPIDLLARAGHVASRAEGRREVPARDGLAEAIAEPHEAVDRLLVVRDRRLPLVAPSVHAAEVLLRAHHEALEAEPGRVPDD